MLKLFRKKINILLFCAVLGSINIGCTTTEKKVIEPAPVVVDPNYDTQSKLKFTERFSNTIPESIPFVEKYRGGHPEVLNYVFVITAKAKIRQRPATNVEVIGEYNFYDTLELLGTVKQKGTTWYKVKGPDGKVGYVYSKLVAKRVFQFEKGLDRVKKVEKFVNDTNNDGYNLGVINSYSPNPNNENFKRDKDKYGTSYDQNTVGTYNGETLYIPDRSIVKILGKDGNKTKVKVQSMPEPYVYVNSSNLIISEKLKNEPINKSIVVDIENQNMVIYEKIKGKWTMISYVHAKTGMESQLGFETPRGSFIAAVSKFEMLYNGEIGNKEGFAKYATRFSGGGYLHGTPVNYEEMINKEYFVGIKEWTLGKYSGTRKCIRTDEDHGKFLFKWILNDKYNSSQNDQVIKDNVLFVIY